MGGDEFIVILPGTMGEDYINIVAQRVLQKVGEPMHIDDKQISVSVSIGIGMCQDDGEEDIHSILRKADAAMYCAEKDNMGYTFYKES